MIVGVLDALWRGVVRPVALRGDAMAAHARFIAALRLADRLPPARWTASALGSLAPAAPVTVGGVSLPGPLVLAAGLVKGDGFADEATATGAVYAGHNIIPGWRTLPALVGPVEFGSYTRHPRPGNPGTVIWRDTATRSTQNRVGLKNPGAVAAAAFLARHIDDLPPVYGVNIAVSPGTTDPAQETREAVESIAAFTSRGGVRPSWFTLNLSCPNTEDDPAGNQTSEKAERLSAAAVGAAGDVPVWVKVGPGLSAGQYAALVRAFAATGVSAVVATNTLPALTPDGSQVAGVGGGRLHADALRAVEHLAAACDQTEAAPDLIGCGGVLDGTSYHAFHERGARAVMYYSAMIYRSPLAAAIIYREAKHR